MRWLARVLLATTALNACGPGATQAPTSSKPAEGAGEAGALCGEHGVLEAICTKCNPALVAVFRAKGDFCEEHGLPESVCPICHPERGGRPAADVAATASDQAPADGTKIRFKTKDTAARAGIETVPATRDSGAAGVSALARVAYDATKLARINARSAGVVKAIKVDIGTTVKKGAPLVTIDSPEVGADRSRLGAARVRVTIAEENHARQASLQKDGILSRQSLLVAEQELSSARGDLAALRASLSALGHASDGATGAGYTLAAPLAGVVTQRTATIGQLVSTEQVLFEIVDTASIWVELEINERDLPLVSVGQKVVLAIDGLEQRSFEGALAYVAPIIDMHTRTAQARLPLANPDGALRANMFGRATVAVTAPRTSVIVPRSAVQSVKDVTLVFIRIRDDEYEARRVELGRSLGDGIEVRRGLTEGEHVVTTGSFLLKTETLKGSIGAGCCEVD